MPYTDKSGGKKILIVEDDPSTRLALVTLLHHLGYLTIPVATVAEGIERLDGQDAAILDLNLPDGLGTSVLQRIRNERRPIRVAVATGSTDDVLLDAVQKLQPEIILHKPIDMNALLTWLERAG